MSSDSSQQNRSEKPIKKPRGIPLSLSEAQIVAAKIRRGEYVDPLYSSWIIDELCRAVQGQGNLCNGEG